MSGGLYLPSGEFRAFSQPEPGRVPPIGEMISRAEAEGTLGWFWGLLPDPDTVLEKLGAESAKVLYALLQDVRVGACIESRKSVTRSKEIVISPGGEGAPEEKAADAAREMVKEWDMGRIVSEVLDAPYWGLAALEVMWETDSKAWTITDLVGKPSWWFGFDNENKLRFITQTNPEGVEVPDYKILLARHGASYHNPYGQRLLSRVFWPVIFKRSGWRLWAEFIETFGSAMITAKAAAGASAPDRQALAVELAAARAQSVLVYPDGAEVNITEAKSKGDSGTVHKVFKDAADADIAVAILGGTLTQEITGQGSRAASETHNEVREDLAEDDEKLFLATVNRPLRWWSHFNFPGVAAPTASFHEEEDLQNERADRDEKLKRLGVRFTKGYFTRAYNLDEEEFELSGDPEDESDPSGEDTGDLKKKAEAELTRPDKDIIRFTKGDDPLPRLTALRERVDRLAEEVLTLEDQNRLAQSVLDLVEEAADLEEVGSLLCRAHDRLDSDNLAEAITPAIFAADMYGRWAVSQETGVRKRKFSSSVDLKPLPMKEAIKFWRGKVKVSPRTYNRLPDEAKVKAFAVAGIAKGDMLNKVWGQLDRALTEGISLSQFKAAVKDDLLKHGWLSKEDLTKTGKLRRKAGRRLENIFRNNVNTAYSVGRYAQLTDPDTLAAFPLWQYIAVDDIRTRPAHRAMSGRVFRADDPIWDQWYPPNGHGCRCDVMALTERQAGKRKLTPEDSRKTGIGETLIPDPGWASNPGKAAVGGHAGEVIGKTGSLKEWPRPLPGPEDYRLPKAGNLKKLDKPPELLPDMDTLKKKGLSNRQIAKHYAREAEETLGLTKVSERIVRTPDGEAVIISNRLFTGQGGRLKLDKGNRGRFIPIFKDTLETPDEIWLTPMMTTDGEVVLRRRQLKFWRGKDGNLAGFAVLDFDRGVWTGVTIYDVQAGQEALDKDYRRGVLLYSRQAKGKGKKE